VTPWILSLSGIESDNFFLRLLKPESFSPIFALVGAVLLLFSKSDRRKNIGSLLLGFAVLMYGMELMKMSMSPLADDPNFANLMTTFTNPLLGVAIGAMVTAVIQSSAASVGILQAMSLTGTISYAMAIPIIMGQNIGTCATALISSIGVNNSARRVAVIHVLFNLSGTAIFLVIFYLGNSIFTLPFLNDKINPVGIAIAHTIFNVATTLMLLPFVKLLEKIAMNAIKDEHDKDDEVVLLDERLLLSSGLAIVECKNYTNEMATISKESVILSCKLLKHYKEAIPPIVKANENKLDLYEDKLGTFLVKLLQKDLSEEDSIEVSKLLHTMAKFEHIGDHATSILKIATEMNEKKISFSEVAISEIKVIVKAVREVLSITEEMFINNDCVLAKRVEPLEQVIDGLIWEAKKRHVKRLQAGKCTIELGLLLTDLLYNLERISDQCSSIAACLIQIKNSSLEKHQYLKEVKSSSGEFTDNYKEFQDKYSIGV
ncbi:Na/Pi cotransporter family protein, partial [bacterium]|nr:Na/Pi cotransporter family protein [bacterium]